MAPVGFDGTITMRKLLALLMLAAGLNAQTAVPTPLQVLAPNDDSASSSMQVQDQAQHFVGFIAPALVTQIVISSATAANPMVLTLANPRPTTILSGGTVTVSGAAGAGCSGMNATHAVSAVGASTITITFNGTGCTYTANSASINTDIWWELPVADGVSGDCLAWSASYVLAFSACGSGGGGANQYLSNLLSPTAINQSLQFATDNTYNIGAAPTGTTRVAPNTIYASTEVEAPVFRSIYYSAGVIQDYFDITTTTSTLYFKDSSANTVGLYSNPAGTPVWQFRGNVVGDTTNTYDLGATTDYWRKLYTTNARVNSMAGGGTQCVQVDNNGDLSATGAGCGGSGSTLPVIDTTNIVKGSVDATKQLRFEVDGFTTATTRTLTPQNSSYTVAGIDITQTFTQNQTLGANLLFSANNTYNIGSSPTGTTRVAPNTIYAWTEVEAPDFRVTYVSGGAIADYFDIAATTSTLYFKDSGATTVGLYSNPFGSPVWQFRGKVVPDATTAYDLGATTALWNKLYTVNARLTGLSGSGTRCVQSDNNGDLSIATAACGGGTVTSVTGTSPISSSGGTTPAISCSTCVTTAGGQSISGTTTLSTASIGTAISGTFSMSGTETVSGSLTIKSTATAGNFYNRVVSDPTVALSCSGVTDGWTAIVHDGSGGAPYWVVCDNTGTRYKVALTAY